MATVLASTDSSDGQFVAAWSFFGWMGCAAAIVLSNVGAAYGTAKSGIGVGAMGVTRPKLIFKSIIPIIMAGILGIYGLIVAVILSGNITPSASYGPCVGFMHLSAGLCCGLSSLAAGYAIGVVGDMGVRANAQTDIFVGMILILIFGEALGLYGLIVAIILSGNSCSG